jgi:hypothetical protein
VVIILVASLNIAMDLNAFYLVALVLFTIGGLMVRNTAPYVEAGCGAYERKRARRLIGQIVLVTAVFSLGIAVIS